MTKYLNRLGDFTVPITYVEVEQSKEQKAVDAFCRRFIRRSIEEEICKHVPVDTGRARAEWITNSVPYIDPAKHLGTLGPREDRVVGRVVEDHGDGTYTIEMKL